MANTGKIEWRDLTVADAEHIADFYSHVVGWQAQPVSMGDYNDFNMVNADGETVAGVCHARGGNTGLPSQWLMYVRVDSVKDSITQCLQLGGKVLHGPRDMCGEQFTVIQDPQGAVLALMSKE